VAAIHRVAVVALIGGSFGRWSARGSVGSRDIDNLFDEHVVFDTEGASYSVFIPKSGCVCIDR
jgi:hypothetical protein